MTERSILTNIPELDCYKRVPAELVRRLAEYEASITDAERIVRSVAKTILRSSYFPEQSNSFRAWKPPGSTS